MATLAKLVYVQFSFSNPDLVPRWFPYRIPELGQADRARRHSQNQQNSPGEMLIEPTEKVFIGEAAGNLQSQGYVLVDAFHTQRRGSGDKVYQVVRFAFARADAAQVSERAAGRTDEVLKVFAGYAEDLWRVRVFRNPNCTPGEFMLSVDAHMRLPLRDKEGGLHMEWERDEHGRKLGDSPRPIQPSGILYIESGIPVIR